MPQFTVFFDVQETWYIIRHIITEYFKSNAHFLIKTNPCPGNKFYAVLTFTEPADGQKVYNAIVALKGIATISGAYIPPKD